MEGGAQLGLRPWDGQGRGKYAPHSFLRFFFAKSRTANVRAVVPRVEHPPPPTPWGAARQRSRPQAARSRTATSASSSTTSAPTRPCWPACPATPAPAMVGLPFLHCGGVANAPLKVVAPTSWHVLRVPRSGTSPGGSARAGLRHHWLRKGFGGGGRSLPVGHLPMLRRLSLALSETALPSAKPGSPSLIRERSR